MARRTYTAEEKADALQRYHADGPAEASRATGIPRGTIVAWASHGGDASERRENLEARVEAAKLSFDQRRTQLAHDLLDDIGRLRAELFAPVTKRQVVTLSGGRDMGATADIVDVDLDCPTFADQKAIMTSIAIAVDKVQILSGGATQRTETIDTSTEKVTALVDELAGRREAKAA